MDDADLTDRLRRAIHAGPAVVDHLSRREALATLLDVHALHLGDALVLGPMLEWQHEPRVAALKLRLEDRLRAGLDTGPESSAADADVEPVVALRRLASEERIPAVYDWLAEDATLRELAEFIAVEGGPDADFDDLVALCQIGLTGAPKVALGANYWDEMGRGDVGAVHTELHRRMASALDVRAVPIEQLPEAALERKALNGCLATNRSLQPEALGNLGLTELQAGPRCRRVVEALQRLDAPADAVPFYAEHAAADPRHGKEWLEGAVAPLVTRWPAWGPRVVRGARWRATVNRRFFAAMADRFVPAAPRAA
jgi:hypothetical protein